MGFLLGFFDKTQKPNPAPKKIGFFPSLEIMIYDEESSRILNYSKFIRYL